MSHPASTLLRVYDIAYGVAVLVLDLPALIALVVGLALLGTRGRRLPGRSHRLAMAGLALLLTHTLLSLLQIVLLRQVFSLVSTADAVRLVNLSANILLGAIFSVGLILLVAALVEAREPAPPSVPADGV